MGKNRSCFEELKIAEWGGRRQVSYKWRLQVSFLRSRMKQVEDADSSGFPGPSLKWTCSLQVNPPQVSVLARLDLRPGFPLPWDLSPPPPKNLPVEPILSLKGFQGIKMVFRASFQSEGQDTQLNQGSWKEKRIFQMNSMIITILASQWTTHLFIILMLNKIYICIVSFLVTKRTNIINGYLGEGVGDSIRSIFGSLTL